MMYTKEEAKKQFGIIGISQQKVANILEVTKDYINKVLNGRKPYSLRIQTKISTLIDQIK